MTNFVTLAFQIVSLFFRIYKIEYIQSIMENSNARKKDRLLSSLLDLRLQNACSRKDLGEQQAKRKALKFCPIKITSSQSQIYENFTIIDKKKSTIDKSLIIKSLGSHFIFSNLIKDKAMQQNLVDKFKLCRVTKGQYLMKQNDNASSFFILHQGELSVQIDGKAKKTLQSGQGFGELALLYSSPRSASIKANKTSFLWFIDRSTFRKAVSSLIEKNYHETRKFIQETSFFGYLTSSQKDKIASIAISQRFSKGQTICKVDQMASSMYIIKYGQLVKHSGANQSKLQQGNYFGEYTMIEKNSKWRETVVADDDCELIALGVEDIENALGKSLPLIVIRNKAKECMIDSKQFTKLGSQYQDIALDCFKIKNVSSDETVSSANMLFLVLQGDYEIVKDSQALIGKLIKANSNFKKLFGSIVQTTNQQIKFKTNGKIAWTTSKQILTAFKGTYQEAVEKSVAIQKTTIKQRDHITELRTECSKYSVNDFKVLTKLGQGQFGTVFLVTDPTKTRLYALKCISKAQTIKNKLEKHLTNEKQVMEEMNLHTPFCVNFIRSYKDENFVYFLLQYINGLELFDVIRIIGILNSDQTRFYSAIMLQFLQKIHSKKIIYRDLKPENVMVSQDGYLKMIDMGTCKKLDSVAGSSGTQKTFTIIGTPNYMAPQIISGKGYSCSADLWSLGIVVYQFMAGEVPFGEEIEDPYHIYQQILKKPLTFPIYMKDQAANSFITQLLSKIPQLRLGGSYNALKRHPFLASIDWSALLQKKMKPAFEIPKNKLIEIEKLINKIKSLSTQLPAVNGKVPHRKDMNLKWDQCF